MALCPHCHHALPDSPPGHCPNCGGDLRSTSVPPPLPSGPGAATEPESALPPPQPSSGTGAPPRPRLPWDERDRIGLFSALVETTRQVLAAPGAFFRAMPVTGELGSPLLYAMVVGWIGLVASALYGAIFQAIVGSRLASLGGGQASLVPILALLESWGGFVMQVVLGPVFVAIGVFAWAGLVHLMLLGLGAGRGGFSGTFGVACYSQAFAVFSLIPFCGTLLVMPYVFVLWVVGLAAAHGIGEARGYVAIVLAIVSTCCCLLGVFVVLGGLAGLVGLGDLATP
jgi:hypothetical protein